MSSEVSTAKKDATAFSTVEVDSVKSKTNNIITWENEVVVYEGEVVTYTDY